MNFCSEFFHKALKINDLRVFGGFEVLNICGKIGAVLALALLFTACREEKPVMKENLEKGSARTEAAVGEAPVTCGDKILRTWDRGDGVNSVHSNLLWVDTACGERVAAIRSIVGRDTLEKRFVLRDSAAFAAGRELPAELKGALVLRTPLQRVVALSSAQIGYMLRLGVEDRIVAVGEGKYIADSLLYARAAAGEVAEIGYGNAMDYEKLMALKPDLVMTFATGGSEDDYSRMEKLGIPVMLTSEWQENSLDTKADWIKLFSSLLDVEIPVEKKVSDSILDPIVYGYPAGNVDPCVEQKLKWVGRNGKHGFTTVARGPRVLAGMSYGGVWYAPGGRSYTADLIRKAGGCYLWASDTTRELRLTIEEVIALADSTDLWINPGMFGTPEEILAAEPRAAHIKAFKNKKVFQNDGRKGPGGGNDFFESAVARPAELLWNLKKQFGTAPEVLPNTTLGKPIRPISVDTSFEWYHNIF